MSHIEHSKNLPKIAIIGRPNTGKSSLFNKILKRRKAIVESVPGVTRDRLCARVRISNKEFILVDTGGIEPRSKAAIDSLVYSQSRDAIDESDAVIFVCEIKTGITYTDEHIASILKKRKAKTFLAVNKADDRFSESDAFAFYGLGLGEPYIISVLNNRGLDALMKGVALFVSELGERQQSLNSDCDIAHINIAVVGMPNVGKSSLVNTILDKQRLIVDDIPGTTRDSVDISIKRNDHIITIIDTAGMRHKKKFRDVIEVFGLSRARDSIRRCDVAFIMVDASRPLSRDDMAVLSYVIKAGKACILLVNKTDLLEDIDFQSYKKNLVLKYRPIEWMPVLFISCKEKKNIIKALDMAYDAFQRSKTSIPTPQLNKLLVRLQNQNPHALRKRIRPKILYATQVSTSPCQFILFCTKASPEKEYLRFIERQIRGEFGLYGIPIDFQIRLKEREGADGS
jgi:GTPase